MKLTFSQKEPIFLRPFSLNESSRFSLLFLFVFFFSYSIPLISSLSTVSISETSNQILICALLPPLSYQSSSYFLNCSSFDAGGLGMGIGIRSPAIPYSGIVSGDGFLCTLSSFPSSYTSVVLRWRFSSDNTSTFSSYKRIYQGQLLNDLQSGNSHICGLYVNGRLQCWQWPGFNSSNIDNNAQNLSSIAVGQDFVCGLSEFGNIRCAGNMDLVSKAPNSGNYSVIAAGFGHACAITASDQRIVCWGNCTVGPPPGQFGALALGENRGCALRGNETVVCWGQNNFSLPEGLQSSHFIKIEAKRSVFCGVLKSNLSLYCWGNENFESNPIVFEQVLPGPCQAANSCQFGPLTASDKFCPQGYAVCQLQPFQNVIPPPRPPPPQPDKEGSVSRWSDKMIAFLVVGCVGSSALLLAFGFFFFKFCKCRGCRVHDSGRLDETGLGAPLEQAQAPAPGPAVVLEKRLSQLASMGNAGHLEEFSLQVLLQATDNFSEDHKIGRGSFGSVYHGTLEDGREVAIKRAEIGIASSTTRTYHPVVGIKHRAEDNDNAFIHELESLSRLHHKNLVLLLGFCEDCNERVLVYEYMHNGSLHDHLHKLESSPLIMSSSPWAARIKVALDAARGIEYLHEYSVPPIIHRDIKSSNILLDAMWTAKVSDFGLSLMGPEDEDSHLSLRAAGTIGYMDPEYYRLQQLSTKSDVYSFGVVLLELLSGCKAIHKNENGVPRNVVDFVVPYIVQDDIHRVLDPRVQPPTPFEIEAVQYVGYLAADCVTLEGQDRPSMTEVVNRLDRALVACLVQPQTSLSPSTTASST